MNPYHISKYVAGNFIKDIVLIIRPQHSNVHIVFCTAMGLCLHWCQTQFICCELSASCHFLSFCFFLLISLLFIFSFYVYVSVSFIEALCVHHHVSVKQKTFSSKFLSLTTTLSLQDNVHIKAHIPDLTFSEALYCFIGITHFFQQCFISCLNV